MKVKVSNMCRILDNHNVLVQERTKQDWPGITFPGGKLEPKESIMDSCIREVKEECGLIVSNLELKGIVTYDVDHGNEYWLIFLFETHSFEGELHPGDQEDPIYWIDKDELLTKPLSLDLEHYIKVYEDDSIQEMHATWIGDKAIDIIFQ